MSEHQASRTLVKSPPELWAECSDARALARHLGDAVGEIRIKRLEPETTVAWEGECISGTVRLEPSGWGTKVTLTATPAGPEAVESPQPEVIEPPEPEVEAEPEPASAPEPVRSGFVARLKRWFASAPVDAAPIPAPVAPPSPPDPAPEPAPQPEPATNQVDLAGALESLGKAHHRPFSRA